MQNPDGSLDRLGGQESAESLKRRDFSRAAKAPGGRGGPRRDPYKLYYKSMYLGN
jgi:hypothetical protein